MLYRGAVGPYVRAEVRRRSNPFYRYAVCRGTRSYYDVAELDLGGAGVVARAGLDEGTVTRRVASRDEMRWLATKLSSEGGRKALLYQAPMERLGGTTPDEILLTRVEFGRMHVPGLGEMTDVLQAYSAGGAFVSGTSGAVWVLGDRAIGIQSFRMPAPGSAAKHNGYAQALWSIDEGWYRRRYDVPMRVAAVGYTAA